MDRELERLKSVLRLWEARVRNPIITADAEFNRKDHQENQEAVAYLKLEIERRERELYE